jgi:nucleoside phosphorylase
MKKLGLVVAMDVEAMQLIEKLNLKKFDESNNIYVSNGYFGKYSSIILIITGIGMENSAIATQTLLLNYDVDIILNFGYAGSNVLRIGTIVSPNKVYNSDFDLTVMGYEKYKIPNTQDLVLDEISQYENYPCYSANHFIITSDENEPVIYDMELHGIAMACNRNNIPLLSIKVITDCLNAEIYNENEADKKFTDILTKSVMKYIEK